MKIRFYIALLLIIGSLSGFAQDPQFSQFYSSPLYMAPSFAGTTDGSRVSANFRDQWPSIPGKFITYSAAFDHYFHSINSGVGVLAFRDHAGSTNLTSLHVLAQYSYNLRITREWVARPGIQFEYAQRSINTDKLVFSDQLRLYGVNDPVTTEVVPVNNINYVDFGTSTIFYSSKYWTGLAINHLLRPNQSIVGGESIVPMKYTFFLGTKQRISPVFGRYKEESITLSLLYKSQGKYDQFDVGGYWYVNPLILGLRYRGIPFFKKFDDGYQNNESVIFVLGMRHNGLNIGYSYDLVVSRLNATGGAHEISLAYLFNQGPPKKKMKIIFPCPHF